MTGATTGWGVVEVVVIDKYRHHPNLTKMHRNVEDVINILSRSGFARSGVDLIGDGEVRTIDNAIRDWEPNRRRAILYWAGHGQALDGGDFYLCCTNTPRNTEPDAYTAMSATHLGELLATKKVAEMVLLVDACNAGGGADRIIDAFRKKVARTGSAGPRPSLAVITSASHRQKARENGFSLALARVLLDGAPPDPDYLLWTDRDRYVTPPELAQALQRIMKGSDFSHLQVPDHGMAGSVGRFFPNPRYRDNLPDIEVELKLHQSFLDADILDHFMVKFRGIDPGDERGWYFTGREEVLRQVVHWLSGDGHGMLVVTGPPGCGKSAVLGRLAVLSSEKYRAEVERHQTLTRAAAGTVPPVGAIDAGVHAKGRTLSEVLTLLAQALDIPRPAGGWQTAGEFVFEVARRKRRVTVLLDALDEAAADSADVIATDLLQPLAELPRVKVLVGTRPNRRLTDDAAHVAEFASPLLRALGAQADDICWLDRDDSRHADISDYARRRLSEIEGSPYRDRPEAARAAAARVAASANGVFLLARLLTRTLAQQAKPLDLGAPHAQYLLAGGVSEVLRAELLRYGADYPRVRDLLASLSWAEGGGLPRHDVWLAVANAVGSRTYEERDLVWLMEHAGAHIVESGEDSQTVYRLYHQAYVDYFQLGADDVAIQAAITDQLIALTSGDSRRNWSTANPYLLRHLAAHAAAGRQLDELCRDADYLIHADPTRLEQVLGVLNHRTRPLIRAYWRAQPLLRAAPAAERAAILHTAALQEEPEALPLLGGEDLAWRGMWSRPSRTTFHRALRGHTQPVLAITSDTANDALVASASVDHTVRLWTAPSGEHRGTLVGHRFPVLAVALSTVGNRTLVASGDSGGVIRVADAADGKLVGTLHSTRGEVTALAFVAGRDAGETVLMAGDSRGVVQIWSLPGLTLVARLPHHYTCVRAITSVRDRLGGRTVLTGGDDGRVRIWDPSRWEPIRTLETTGWVYSLAADVVKGRLIAATGGEFGTVTVWDATAGTHLASCVGHQGAINAVAFGRHAGKPVLATAGDDGGVRMWDPISGTPTHVLRQAPAVHLTTVEKVQAQHEMVALVTSAGSPGISEDSDPPAYLISRSNSVTTLRFVHNEDRAVLVTGSADAVVRLWDLDDVDTQQGEAGPKVVSAVFGAFAGERTSLVTGDREGKLACWDPKTGDRQSELTVPSPVQDSLAVVQTSAGNVVVFTDGEDKLHIWNPIPSAKEPDRLVDDRVLTVVCGAGPDGPFAVVATRDGGVDLISLDTMTRRPLFDPGYPVVRLALGGLRQAPWVAMAGFADNAVDVVDLGSGKRHQQLALPEPAAALASHVVEGVPVLAIALNDGVRIWKLGARRWKSRHAEAPSANVECDSPVRAVTFAAHPSGPLAVAGNDDGRVWLLDPAQCMRVFDLAAHTAPVRALACTTIGQHTTIASCGDDGIHVMELSAGNWRQQAADMRGSPPDL